VLSASNSCKCLRAYYVRLAELSASDCKRLWKALCYNSEKEDLAKSVKDLLSSVKLILRLCACKKIERSK
jgi:hypothetical protein